MTEPTYIDGVRDCVERIEQLAIDTGGNAIDVRLILGELESLHPRQRNDRERKRSEKAEQVVFDFACKIVAAAWNDWRVAREQSPNVGNTIATVHFNAAQVVLWARYAAARKHTAAAELLELIERGQTPISMGI